MRERPISARDYPTYASSPRDYLPPEAYTPAPNPVLPPESLYRMLDDLSPAHAADVREAIKVAEEIESDVHLYKKLGSQFLGIAFQPASSSSPRVFEYPEIR